MSFNDLSSDNLILLCAQLAWFLKTFLTTPPIKFLFGGRPRRRQCQSLFSYPTIEDQGFPQKRSSRSAR